MKGDGLGSRWDATRPSPVFGEGYTREESFLV